MTKKKVERYALNQSPLYRLGRRVDLANLLKLTPKQLRDLIIKRIAYYNFSDVEIGGKNRSLAVPIYEMRAVHERLAALLGRIALPDYLYSPRKARTAVNNAGAHRGADVIVKLDIKQFYPSTTDEHVFQFFKHRLRMVDDMAGRLTKLCTINGRVPFGSPLSPILCAHVHDDVFTKVAAKCELRGDKMTLWVDDLTASGPQVSKLLVRDIQRLLKSKRLKPHKTKRTKGSNGVVITGAFVHPRGMAPANKTHVKIREKLEELKACRTAERQLKVVRSLIGLTVYSISVYSDDSDARKRAKSRLAWLHNLSRSLTAPEAPAPIAIDWTKTPHDDTAAPPWE